MSAAPPFPDVLRAGDAGLAPIPDVEESWARISAWFEDARVRRWYGGESHRCTPAQAREKYGPRARGEHWVRAVFITLREAPVGYLQFYRVEDPREYQLPEHHDVSGTWALDLFIGEPGAWGQGLGSCVIGLLCDHLEGLGAREVLIDPREENARAQRAYRRAGFEVVGKLYAFEEHDGVTHDGVLMRRALGGQRVER